MPAQAQRMRIVMFCLNGLGGHWWCSSAPDNCLLEQNLTSDLDQNTAIFVNCILVPSIIISGMLSCQWLHCLCFVISVTETNILVFTQVAFEIINLWLKVNFFLVMWLQIDFEKKENG